MTKGRVVFRCLESVHLHKYLLLYHIYIRNMLYIENKSFYEVNHTEGFLGGFLLCVIASIGFEKQRLPEMYVNEVGSLSR